MILAVFGALLTSLAGMEVAGFVHLFPKDWAPVLAIIPPAAATLVHLVMLIGDILDDGVKNDSFGWKAKDSESGKGAGLGMILILLSLTCLIGLPSCGIAQNLVSGTTPATVPVSREGGQAFEVVTADVLTAETQPESIWGLYDAGAVMKFADFRKRNSVDPTK